MPLVEWLDNYEKRHLPNALYEFDTHEYLWYSVGAGEPRPIHKADGYVETLCPNCEHQGYSYQFFFPGEVTGVGCQQCRLPLARIFLKDSKLYTTSIYHPYHDGFHKRALIYLGCIDFWTKAGNRLGKARHG